MPDSQAYRGENMTYKVHAIDRGERLLDRNSSNCPPVAMKRLLAAVWMLAIWFTAPVLRSNAQAPRKPLSKQDVIRLLEGNVSPARVGDLARQHGIDFQVIPETERELRAVLEKGGSTPDATKSFLGMLRMLAPKPPGSSRPASSGAVSTGRETAQPS
jgi:hypothetical protein